MSYSPNLNLPYIAPTQAQKHVTHNEALQILDSVIHLSIIDRDLSLPPTQPDAGARYLVGDDAQGAWLGHDGELASFENGHWQFMSPQPGWIIWVADEQEVLVFDGENWGEITGSALTPEIYSKLGINAQADDTNRLTVKSDAVLLSHDDVTPGSGDVRVAVNKLSESHTASLIFQNNYSGRAEFGLSGNDDFQIRVSSAGQVWTTALSVDGGTGQVSFPNTTAQAVPLNLLQDAGRFSGAPEPQGVRVSEFQLPSYLTPYNSALFEQGDKFVYNNSTYGGSGEALSPLMVALIEKIKGASVRRYGVEFYTLKITAGAGTAGALTVNGNTYYLGFSNITAPIPTILTASYFIYVESGELAIGRSGQPYINGQYSDSIGKVITPAQGWTQVTQLISYTPNNYLGYQANLFRVYAQLGSVYHIAAPSIIAGHVSDFEAEISGVVPSITAWR